MTVKTTKAIMRDRVKFIEAARRRYLTGSIDIDGGAQLKEVDVKDGGGAWVAAWVWVGDEEIEAG